MKNQYWHFGYVFVIGALSFFASQWYRQVKDLERDLVDATDTMRTLNKGILNSEDKRLKEEIHLSMRRTPKYKVECMINLDKATKIDTFLTFIDQQSKSGKIDWGKFDKKYIELLNILKNNIPNDRSDFIKAQSSFSQIISVKPSLIVSQDYWLERYKAIAKMLNLAFLNYTLDRSSGMIICGMSDTFLVGIQPKNSAIKLGESFDAEVSIVRLENLTCDNPDITLTINGTKTILQSNGSFYKYIYKEKPKKLGKQPVELHATITDPTTREKITIRRNIEYYVIP